MEVHLGENNFGAPTNYRVPIPYHTISGTTPRDRGYFGSLSGSPIEIWRVYSFDFVFGDLDGFSCFLKGFCQLNHLRAWRTSYGRCVWDFKRALPSIPISASLFQPMYELCRIIAIPFHLLYGSMLCCCELGSVCHFTQQPSSSS